MKRSHVAVVALFAALASAPALAAQSTGTSTGQGTARTHKPAKKLSPAQKAYQQALRAEEKKLHDAVKAGTLTRKSAADELKAWRAANKPTAKTP